MGMSKMTLLLSWLISSSLHGKHWSGWYHWRPFLVQPSCHSNNSQQHDPSKPLWLALQSLWACWTKKQGNPKTLKKYFEQKWQVVIFAECFRFLYKNNHFEYPVLFWKIHEKLCYVFIHVTSYNVVWAPICTAALLQRGCITKQTPRHDVKVLSFWRTSSTAEVFLVFQKTLRVGPDF